MKLLCCDGPLNGQYRDINLRGVKDGNRVIVVFPSVVYPDSRATYEVQTWTGTGERVLVWVDAKVEIEEFAEGPDDWELEADFNFPKPLSTLIQEAVQDAEVR